MDGKKPQLLDIECQGVWASADHGGHHHIDREVTHAHHKGHHTDFRYHRQATIQDQFAGIRIDQLDIKVHS
jgi:hypothetical protein